MMRHNWRHFLLGSLLALVFWLYLPTFLGLAQDPQTGQTGPPAEQLDPEAVDAHVAGMTDEQVRQAYTQTLKEEAAM